MSLAAPALAQDMLGNQAFIVQTGATSSTLTEKMRVTSGGLVGIGVTSPSTALQVRDPNGGAQSNVYIGKTLQGFESGDVWSGAIYFGVPPTSAIATTAGIEASWGTSTLPQIHIGTLRGNNPTSVNMYYTGLIRLDVSGTQAMAVKYVNATTSRVGVSTQTPVTALDVSGTLRIADSGDACDASHLGSIKYSSAKFYLCRSAASGWEELTLGGGSADVQTFLASGTWTKPGSGKMTKIECWGGGGGGSTAKAGAAGGGGGGAYSVRQVATSQLGATETVTIGAGGAVDTNGSNSTFGTWLTAYSGAKGVTNTDGLNIGLGGGGGGLTSAGSGQTPGGPLGMAGYMGGTGGTGGTAPTAGGDSINGGGGGGGGHESSANYGSAGGNSIYGGGGGGGRGNSSNKAGGTSWFGGAGGAGSVTGTQPGGGGGGSAGGGDGECIVTTY